MEKLIKINDQITVGPQPSEKELQQLKEMGFKSIVNVRSEGEEKQPLSPQAEGDKVRAIGLEYLHIPVPMKDMIPEPVDEFRRRFAELPKPVFSHCMGGKRAGVLAVIQAAIEQGISGDETIKRANEKGLGIDKPELVQFVRQYVDDHSAASKEAT